MGTVLDTCVVIQSERAGRELQLAPDEEVAVAAVTVSELLHGVHRAADADQAARRESFVTRALHKLPTLPFDEDVARVHARVWAELSARGKVPGAHDLIIAATAVAHGWEVATFNVQHFSRVPGLRLRPPQSSSEDRPS